MQRPALLLAFAVLALPLSSGCASALSACLGDDLFGRGGACESACALPCDLASAIAGACGGVCGAVAGELTPCLNGLGSGLNDLASACGAGPVCRTPLRQESVEGGLCVGACIGAPLVACVGGTCSACGACFPSPDPEEGGEEDPEEEAPPEEDKPDEPPITVMAY